VQRGCWLNIPYTHVRCVVTGANIPPYISLPSEALVAAQWTEALHSLSFGAVIGRFGRSIGTRSDPVKGLTGRPALAKTFGHSFGIPSHTALG
jgi:hypothetical protein